MRTCPGEVSLQGLLSVERIMLEVDRVLKNKVEKLTDFLLTIKQGVKKKT